MAIERWTDDRLDNLASTVADLRSACEALLQTAIVHQQGLETSQRNFEAIVTEIRGLQTENRRILDHLFGQENNNE